MDKQEQALNEKLAKWAGFKRHNELWYSCPSDDCWAALPSFTQSLNTCFKYLAPKLAENGFVITVGSYEHSGYYACAYWFMNPEPQDVRAETPALALCQAIEQLIDSKGKYQC